MDENAETSKPTPKNAAEIINERLRRKSLPYHVAKTLTAINTETEATNSTENLFYDNGSAPSNPTERRQLLQQLDTSFIASDESKVNTTQDTNILASSEELSDTGSEPTLFTKIVRCAKKALLETKNLKDKASNKETPEDQIIDCAKTTAKCTIELIELIKSQIPKDDKDRNLQQSQLLESATKVKTNVLAFIPAARSFNSNPFDFLSKQQLNNSGSEVVSAIREMLSVAETLLKPNNDSKTEDNLKKNSVFLIEVATKINVALKELVVSVDSKTTISLSDLISNVAQEATHFINTASKQGDSSMETRIKETLLNLAVAARASFKNRTDIVVRQQFKKNIEDLVSILRDFLSKYCGKFIQGNTELISVPHFDVNVNPPNPNPPPTTATATTPTPIPIPTSTPASNQNTPSTSTTAPTNTPTTKPTTTGVGTSQQTNTGIVRAAIPSSVGGGTPGRTERTKTLASQRLPVPSKDFMNKLENSLQKQPPSATNTTSNDNNDNTMPSTISKTSVGSTSAGSLPVKPLPVDTNSNSSSSIDSISSISDALVHLFQDRYKSFANDWKNQNSLYNNETNRLTSNLIQKQNQNQNLTGKDDPVVSDLIKLLTSKSNNRDWEDVEKELKAFTRNVTQRLRKEYFFSSNANSSSGNLSSSLSVEEQICDCSANLGELLIDLLLCLHDLICKTTASNSSSSSSSSPSTASKTPKQQSNYRTEDLTVYLENFKGLLKRCVELSREWILTDKLKTATLNRTNSVVSRSSFSAAPSSNDKELDSLMNVIESNLTSISNLSTRGKLNQTIINAITDSQTTGLSNYFSTKLKLEETLTNSLSNDSYSIRVLAIQLMTALTSLASLSNKSDFMIIYQIIGICKVTISKLENILNNFETLIYIINTESINEKSISKLRKSLQSENTDVNIWSSDKYSIVRSNQNGSFLGGTINHIVLHLTSEQDSKFLATFIIMYKSFTTPTMLLEKLQQRYTIPKEVKLSEADSARIKFRVCVVLQEWIKNQFDDFDKELIEKVKQFIYELEKDGKKVIADRLIKEIQNKIKDRERYKNSILDVDPWIQLKIPEGGFSPVSFIMGSTDAEIARQFTMIEFQIFHKIQSSEFLNLSWNTPKLQHKSPNVLDLISRANQLSYWVASLIIWSSKLNDRVNVILKCIQIAQHLLQLSNFNTLMSFIAGLNISAVSRLKLTWAAVEKNHPAAMENLRKIQGIFDPSNSNKTYRKAHNDATSLGPCLPYLAVFLSDLTFSEEGNPDSLENSPFLINYAKREIICNIIRKIQLNQHPPYQFPLVEPLNTFLSELPFYTEKDLYDLSLLREPRVPEASTSTGTLR